MTTFELFVESGPKRRKTMVHMPALLGCIAQGPTTEQTLDDAPDAIRTFLRFVAAHGEAADPGAAVEVRVAEHVTQGIWLGNGDPSIVFACDVAPVTPEEVAAWTARWHAIRNETEAVLAPLSDAAFTEEPARGRGAARISRTSWAQRRRTCGASGRGRS